jgi:hypothetical protein
VTNQPPHDARPNNSLHKRLTVAMANASDRALLADAMAGDSTVVRSDDLWAAADTFVQERAVARLELRGRLDAVAARAQHDRDTAGHQLDHLVGRRQALVDGADWATALHASLPEHLSAVQAVRDALDERRNEQRAAQQDLDRVLEQRTAVAEAIEQADQELAEVSSSGMDETGLRRELEASGQAVRRAREEHATASARLEQLQIERTGLEVRFEATAPAAVPDINDVDGAAVATVRRALAQLQAGIGRGQEDPHAVALCEAWQDLTADLAEFGGELQDSSGADLAAARRRVEQATARLSELGAAAMTSTLTAEERSALDAAHAAVLAAEEQASRRRRGSALRQLEQAQAVERALLDQHGFGGYLDVVLTGGRIGAADPALAAAEREHFEATLALEALERAARVSPELAHLRSEQARLLQHVVDLLCVDPGHEVLPLLRSHRLVPRELQQALAEALAAVGVRPVGASLEAAALGFLEAHPLPSEVALDAPEDDDRIAIEARLAALVAELDAAQAEVDRTAEALQMAERSVGAFENELTVRAGEDLQRMQRFAAAEQLRAQIDAVATTLRKAEAEARRSVDAVDQVVAAAEADFDQASADLADLARQARTLAEELPIDLRPEGDPLHSLVVLAERLLDHANVLQPEIAAADAAVATASVQLEEALAAARLAATGEDGPLPEDLAAGLQQILAAATDIADTVVLLDEPLAGVDPATRTELLELVRVASAAQQTVLLTEDPEVLGWAIELPIEEGSAMPADALLLRMRRANEGLNLGPAAVDITSTAIDPDAAPTARWAGRR